MKTILIILIVGCLVAVLFVYLYHEKETNIASDDTLIVEQYIRDNIKTLAPESPVLGGSWYVVSIAVDPNTKTGDMIYEDGHIQGKATFFYEYNNEIVKISNIIKR
jgi:hypothetical protein